MSIEFKNQLSGDRLILKRTIPDIKMAEEIFKVIDRNRENLDPWFLCPKLTLKIEDTLKYLFEKEEEKQKKEKK